MPRKLYPTSTALPDDPRQRSDWVKPVMEGYRMACCDCGLVHELDFMAVKITRQLGNGLQEFKPLPPDKFQVEFRARRNNQATAQLRRHRHGPACIDCGEPKPHSVTLKGRPGKYWQCRKKSCGCIWKAKSPTTKKPK